MNYFIKYLFTYLCLMISNLLFSQYINEATEPSVKGNNVIDLLEGGTLNAWEMPSSHWNIEGGNIIGDTGGEKLTMTEWLYTKQQFDDFEFTCELKLTGDNRRNTGIYYRVNTFLFKVKERSYEAPSGYEFEASYYKNPKG